MNTFNKYTTMKKRGLLLEIGALIVIAITTLGVFITVSKSSELYVGNNLHNETKNYVVDYYKCKDIAKRIPDENLMVFKSLEEATNSGFKAVEGCI